MLTMMRFACREGAKHARKLGGYEVSGPSGETLREKEKGGLDKKGGEAGLE